MFAFSYLSICLRTLFSCIAIASTHLVAVVAAHSWIWMGAGKVCRVRPTAVWTCVNVGFWLTERSITTASPTRYPTNRTPCPPEPESRLLGVLRDAAEHQLRRLSTGAGALLARPQGQMRKKEKIFCPEKYLSKFTTKSDIIYKSPCVSQIYIGWEGFV